MSARWWRSGRRRTVRRSATAGWRTPGSAAAPARSADVAMKSRGVFSNGGYSEYLMLPHPRYLIDIGDLPADRAAPLACSGVTTYGALKKVGPTLATEPVVIIGAGGLGLMCIAIHKAMGGKSAIVVDIDPKKREAAKAAGADLVF